MKETKCTDKRKNCRAVDGERMCTALLDTDFGGRACPFYKESWQFEWELTQIAKGREGFTPILCEVTT